MLADLAMRQEQRIDALKEANDRLGQTLRRMDDRLKDVPEGPERN
jgi:hypothetical protein